MPQHPTSPPSDCASTHSVSTDADTRTYGDTVMMVNRPSLEKYNFEDSGPAKVADSTRTHMAAVNKPNRKAAPTSSIRTAKLHSHAHVTRTHSHTHTRIYTHPHRTRKKREKKARKGGQKGKEEGIERRGRRRVRKKKPQKERRSRLQRQSYPVMYYKYIYMIYVCESKEESAASGNAAKKKKKRERMNVANLSALAYPRRSTCYY